MGLPSFLKRPPSGRPQPSAAAGSVESARAHARRRLIGAALLVVLGVLGLPLLFDTTPRPLPVDIPIDLARQDGPPAVVAAPVKLAPASAAVTRLGTAAAPAAASSAPPAPPPLPKVEAPVAIKEPPPAAEAARAQAALQDKPVPAASPAAVAPPTTQVVDASARFVVQVGAYTEAASAQAARARVEKLGLKTYTQTVETATGPRIRVRVGPYEQRAEAEKVAARLEQAGLPTAVMSR